MTVVIQLSYILRGLLRAAKPTYKKGCSLNIYIPLFCWSLLLRQGIYLLKYCLLVYDRYLLEFSIGIWLLVVGVFY
jgi:hypothetical protein